MLVDSQAGELAALLDRAIALARSQGDNLVANQLQNAKMHVPGVDQSIAITIEILSGEVRRDGAIIDLPERELCLLMALATAGGVCSQADLCERMYPNRRVASPRSLLKVYIHRIRRRLGSKSAIISRTGGYALHPEISIDLPKVQAFLTTTLGANVTTDLQHWDALAEVSARLRLARPSRMRGWSWFADLDAKLILLGRDIAFLLAREALAAGRREQALYIARELQADNRREKRANDLIAEIQGT